MVGIGVGLRPSTGGLSTAHYCTPIKIPSGGILFAGISFTLKAVTSRFSAIPASIRSMPKSIGDIYDFAGIPRMPRIT